MRVIFCRSPLDPRRVDDDYRSELEAADRAGCLVDLVDHDALVHDTLVAGDAARAVQSVRSGERETTALYRGWMTTAAQYRTLFDALLSRGARLVNDPDQYRTAHELPRSFPFIAAHTPRAAWLEVPPAASLERIIAALARFGDAPVVLKDYVKSRKHEWAEACFIPSASDATQVERVVSRFLELQGDDLYGGLVFREYVPLAPVGTHPRSGAPLFDEHRLFFLDGTPILSARYWSEVAYDEGHVPVEHFARIARTIPCRFLSMDIARRQGGGWTIIEVGDGQVTGLPEHADRDTFYERIAEWGAGRRP